MAFAVLLGRIYDAGRVAMNRVLVTPLGVKPAECTTNVYIKKKKRLKASLFPLRERGLLVPSPNPAPTVLVRNAELLTLCR